MQPKAKRSDHIINSASTGNQVKSMDTLSEDQFNTKANWSSEKS